MESSPTSTLPLPEPPATGAISGIVGAGGNIGAVCFGLGFRNLEYKEAFILIGFTIFGSSILGLICSKDDPKEEAGTLAVPVKEEIKA